MPHLDNNIPSNIYYASIGFEILRFTWTTSDINTFVTLSNRILKRKQKQVSKYRSIKYMLNKIFGKHFTVSTNFIKFFPLPWIRTIHIHVCLLHILFLLFVFLFFCLFVCLFVCVVIMLLLLQCHLSLFLYVCYRLCSYGLVFCAIILLQ